MCVTLKFLDELIEITSRYVANFLNWLNNTILRRLSQLGYKKLVDNLDTPQPVPNAYYSLFKWDCLPDQNAALKKKSLIVIDIG